MLGPQAMVSNIKNALHSQRSVVNVLYSKADVAMISRFTRAVERIAYKPPECFGFWLHRRLVHQGRSDEGAVIVWAR